MQVVRVLRDRVDSLAEDRADDRDRMMFGDELVDGVLGLLDRVPTVLDDDRVLAGGIAGLGVRAEDPEGELDRLQRLLAQLRVVASGRDKKADRGVLDRCRIPEPRVRLA